MATTNKSMLREDPDDYTEFYNTQLSKEEEVDFQEWVMLESDRQGRDISKDLYDYDLRGLWKEGGGFDGENGHARDTYKKPNHMTFSDQSKYNGAEGVKGGKWSVRYGQDVYTVSKTSRKDKQRMQEYFEQYEPGVLLEFEK